MKLVIAYLILKTVGSSFVSIYIKLIVFLAVVSLFGYASDQFNLFDGLIRKLPPVGKMGYEGIFYVYRFPWHMPRNNSIFYEPGAYQAFLNAALFLLAFTETSFDSRTKWIFIGILGATLVTTFSTAGFVIFALMFPVFLYKSRIATFSGKIKIVAVVFAVIAVFAAQFYSSFRDQNGHVHDGRRRSKYSIRQAERLTAPTTIRLTSKYSESIFLESDTSNMNRSFLRQDGICQ